MNQRKAGAVLSYVYLIITFLIGIIYTPLLLRFLGQNEYGVYSVASSAIAFLAYGIIAWNCGWLEGYQEIAIFSFILVGALIGFLMYNSHPAKVFMGDLGSLSLGGALATIAILTRHELSLFLIGGVFIIEAASSLIQIIAIRKFNKKIFKKAPLHHHFEELNWEETDIVKLFWTVGLIFAMIAITYGVWL